MNKIKINHIYMLERFFKMLNRDLHCKIDLNNKYPLSEEKQQLDNVEFSKNCKVFIRNCLPYTVEKLEDNKFIFLNREYKPLGVFGYSEIVDYKDFKFLEFEYKDDISRIYFHADSNRPQDSRKDYIEYLIRLKYFLIDYKNNEIVLDKDYYKYTENIKFSDY